MKMMAKSQPNLLASLQQEELAAAGEREDVPDGQDSTDQDHFSLNSVNQLRGALSVHNLLEEGTSLALQEIVFQGSMINLLIWYSSGAKVRAGRRKSALVAHWENRIQHQEFWTLK